MSAMFGSVSKGDPEDPRSVAGSPLLSFFLRKMSPQSLQVSPATLKERFVAQAGRESD